MRKPPLKTIDAARKQGFRPVVVSCFLSPVRSKTPNASAVPLKAERTSNGVNNKKILFVYKKEHNLWQLPQGGIENNEDIDNAFRRETIEELSKKFADSMDKEIIFLGDDQIEFPPSTQDTRELKDDDGNPHLMRDKKYFFIAANAGESKINIKKTEFDDYRWLSHNEAVDFTQEIYQPGKRRITLKAVELLKSLNLV